MKYELLNSTNPWLGLQTYTEDKQLYGRNRDVAALTGIIEHNVASVLYGRSGIGKSSLIHAGIFPHLRAYGYLPIYIRFEHNTNQSYVDQIKSVVKAATKGKVEVNDRLHVDVDNGLWDFFHRYEYYRYVEVGGKKGKETVQLVLVIDQFEEIYTLADENHKDYAQQLYEELATVFNNIKPDRIVDYEFRGSGYHDSELDYDADSKLTIQIPTSQKHNYKEATDCHFVITLREDYLFYLERNTSKIPSLKVNRYALRALDVQGAKDVICMPLPDLYTEEQAYKIIDKLAVIDDNDEKQIDPTILSVFLYKSFQSHGKTSSDNIIADFYRDETKNISEHSLAYLEEHLLTGQGFRQDIPYSDAIDNGITSEELTKLINSRILTKESKHGHDYIEFSHDVLCPIAKQGRDDRMLRLQKARLKKRITIVSTIFAALVIFGLAISILAYKVIEKDKEVTKLEIYNKSIQASHLTEEGDVLGAIRQLLKLAPDDLSDNALSPETEAALYEAYDSLNTEYASIAHLRHADDVNSAIYSNDGEHVITASSDGYCYIWKSCSGDTIGKVGGDGGKMNYAEYSHNNKLIVTASADKTSVIWDATTLKQKVTLKGHTDDVLYASFSPDDKSVVTAGKDGTVRLWDVKSGKEERVLAQNMEEVTSCHFSKDGKNVLISSAVGTSIIDLKSSKVLPITDNPSVSYANYSNDGKHVITVANSEIKIWDSSTRNLISTFTSPIASYLVSANFSPDGKNIAFSCSKGEIGIWQWGTTNKYEIFGKHSNIVRCVSFSPDGKFLISSARDNLAKIWNLRSNNIIALNGQSNFATINSDGNNVASTISLSNTLQLWQINQSSAVTDKPIPLLDEGYSVAFRNDNKEVVVSTSNGQLQTYNVQDGRCTNSTPLLQGNYNYAMYLPDNKNVVAISNERVSVLWNTQDGAVSHDYFKNNKPLNDIALSPDGGWWLLAQDGNNDVILQSFKNPSKRTSLKGHTATVEAVDFSKDGKYAVSGANDNDVIVWDIATCKALSVLKGHTSQVYFVQFSPDRKYVYSASTDWTVRIWNLSNGHCVRVFKNVSQTQLDTAMSIDGKKLLVANNAGINIYSNPTPTELIEYLKKITRYEQN